MPCKGGNDPLIRFLNDSIHSGEGEFHFCEFDGNFVKAHAGGADADNFAAEVADRTVGQGQRDLDELAWVDKGAVDEGEAGARQVAGGDVEGTDAVITGGVIGDMGDDAVAAAMVIAAFVGGVAGLLIEPFEGLFDGVGDGGGG